MIRSGVPAHATLTMMLMIGTYLKKLALDILKWIGLSTGHTKH